MINNVYRLVSPQSIHACFEERSLDGEGIIVRPIKLSICAADQRYYTGSRGKEAMRKKLPMALIHEGVGIVVCDPKGEYKSGQKVVLVPNTPTKEDENVAENYLRSSKFRASGFDGFMQDYICMGRDRVVLYKDIDDNVASFMELISVAVHSITRFERKSINTRETLGIWGDGNLGFITALLLKNMYPSSKIIVFGKNQDKLSYFSFADSTYLIDEIPNDIEIDHAFEAVGGNGSELAIKDIIDLIKPEGTICLMGVSENPVPINTRMVLEKGITLIGSSRSGRIDFQKAVDILEGNKEIQGQLKKLVANVIEVRKIEDIMKAFNEDLNTPFKTIMDWNI